MFVVGLLLIIVLAATFHIAVHLRSPRATQRVAEIFLVYLLVGYYGLGMILSATVHLLNPMAIGQLKGWVPSRPFQALYAFALLGLAASALLTAWLRGSYVLAPAISGSLLLFGGAYVHGSEILAAGHFSVARDGPEVLSDFLVPVTVLCLAAVHWRYLRIGAARV